MSFSFPWFFSSFLFSITPGFYFFSLFCKSLELKHRLLSAWFWLWYRKSKQEQYRQSVHEWICCALVFETVTSFLISSGSKNEQVSLKCFPLLICHPFLFAIKEWVAQAFIWKHRSQLIVAVIELLVLKISTLSSLEFRYCYDNCTFNSLESCWSATVMLTSGDGNYTGATWNNNSQTIVLHHTEPFSREL